MTSVAINDQLAFTVYDSLKELPASLYAKSKQYEVMATELGGSEEQRDSQLQQIELYAKSGLMAEFTEALHNYRLARRLALVNYQPGQLEWVCLIASANEKPLTDYSEEGLTRLIAEWSALGLTQQHIESIKENVKKNS